MELIELINDIVTFMTLPSEVIVDIVSARMMQLPSAAKVTYLNDFFPLFLSILHLHEQYNIKMYVINRRFWIP